MCEIKGNSMIFEMMLLTTLVFQSQGIASHLKFGYELLMLNIIIDHGLIFLQAVAIFKTLLQHMSIISIMI